MPAGGGGLGGRGAGGLGGRGAWSSADTVSPNLSLTTTNLMDSGSILYFISRTDCASVVGTVQPIMLSCRPMSHFYIVIRAHFEADL